MTRLKNIRAIRLEIALLVMGAIISMSMIAMAAAFTVSMARVHSDKNIMLRFQTDSLISEPGLKQTVSQYPVIQLAESLPSNTLTLAYALLIVAGSAAVGLIVSNLVVRPLAELQKAIEAVGPQGLSEAVPILAPSKDLGTTQMISTLTQKLQDAMESRMRLVASAGHDLRTPITRMRLRLEFLESEEERLQWEKDINELTEIADSAIKLVKEEIAGDHEFLSLDAILEGVCSELKEIGHDIFVADIIPCVISGGYHSIRRALTNLIGNACKHGLCARVSLSVTGDQAIIRVADVGPGIPDDQMERVFEPFYRVGGATEKKVEGAGLGLAIAKEIIQRHKGSITFENRKPHGLLQTISLPTTLLPAE